MGANPELNWEQFPDTVSIHAPVMGAKLIAINCPDVFCSFNPRTRNGCEILNDHNEAVRAVSIHAPVMGANIVAKVVLYFFAFQSTHP